MDIKRYIRFSLKISNIKKISNFFKNMFFLSFLLLNCLWCSCSYYKLLADFLHIVNFYINLSLVTFAIQL